MIESATKYSETRLVSLRSCKFAADMNNGTAVTAPSGLYRSPEGSASTPLEPV